MTYTIKHLWPHVANGHAGTWALCAVSAVSCALLLFTSDSAHTDRVYLTTTLLTAFAAGVTIVVHLLAGISAALERHERTDEIAIAIGLDTAVEQLIDVVEIGRSPQRRTNGRQPRHAATNNGGAVVLPINQSAVHRAS